MNAFTGGDLNPVVDTVLWSLTWKVSALSVSRGVRLLPKSYTANKPVRTWFAKDFF